LPEISKSACEKFTTQFANASDSFELTKSGVSAFLVVRLGKSVKLFYLAEFENTEAMSLKST